MATRYQGVWNKSTMSNAGSCFVIFQPHLIKESLSQNTSSSWTVWVYYQGRSPLGICL